MRTASHHSRSDERELLLPPIQDEQVAKLNEITPLPKLQLLIVFLIQIGEPMSASVIFPFINQLVRELDITGGDPKKVGYYAGLIESLFFATQAMCTFNWSRASDHFGRKPVILIGLGGLCLSMISFGLSRTFWSLVVSRSLAGLLNGNIGVTKSMVGELTDSTNRAQVIAFIPFMWCVGGAVAQLSGGFLSHPYDRFPRVFGYKFWENYPYLLPCLFSASYTAFVSLGVLFFLEETVHKPQNDAPTNTATLNASGATSDGPVPLRDLLTRPIMLSIANYGLIAFCDICLFALMPLFYSTPIELGGMGFDPPAIGICFAIYGVMNGVLQAMFFAKVVGRFGPKQLIVAGGVIYPVIFALFPVINKLALAHGMSRGVCAVMVVQLFLVIAYSFSFGSIFMFVTSSAPSKRSLGSVNGMAQTTASIVRAVGPAASTSLFAYSLQTNWLGGSAVYLIIMSLSIPSICFALQLPGRSWKQNY